MKKFVFLFAIGVLGVQPRSMAGQENTGTTRYTFMLSGNKAGFESSTRNADGSLQIHYEFNDRGRGPSINEKLVAGKDGIPTFIETSGNDYMKAPVEEHFSLSQGKANWKNRSEQGEKSVTGKAF